MKKMIFLLSMIVISSCSKNDDNLDADLFEKLNLDTTESLTDISFINKNQGIVCGSLGFLAKTNDGGKSWTNLNVGVKQTFLSAFMFDEQNFYTARLGLFSTSNSGNTFSEIGDLSSGSSIFDLKFYNPAQGLLLRGGEILKSNDHGNTWEEKYNTDSFSSLTNLQITSSLVSYASGGTSYDNVNRGEIVKSTDSGQSWIRTLDSNSNIYSISFISDNIGYYINAKKELYKTSNGSNSWTKIADLPSSPLYICFIDENVGYLSTYEGHILETKDAGLNWKIVYNKTSHPIVKIISKDNAVFAIGESGLFLKIK